MQPSRFSALNIDSDSDSDASGSGWIEIAKGTRQKGKEGEAATAGRQHRDGAQGHKPLSKSAKKRARKKRNQQSSSEVSFEQSCSI